MAKPNPANLLALEQKKAQQQIEDIQRALADKTNALLLDIKKELASKLSEALEVFSTIPVEARKGVLGEPAFDLILNSLGLQTIQEEKAKKRSSRVPRAELSDEAIIKFIGKEHKKTGEIVAHFAGGKKVNEALARLVESGHLKVEKIIGKGKPASGYTVAKK